jgi:hypothetical protein
MSGVFRPVERVGLWRCGAILVAAAVLVAATGSAFDPTPGSTSALAAQKKSAKKKTGGTQRKPQARKKKDKADADPPKLPKRAITVAKVDPATLENVKASAAEIDRLVEANYATFKVEPNPLTTDEQFVRRIYLDITGTIPTHRQVNTFLKSNDPDKRTRLIDNLLNSWGYASHHYNYWGDVLRITDDLQNRLPATAYNEWIKIALEENKPYDKLVYEMLTASGKVFDEPAAGYLLRDAGMPLDNMNNTVRIFLGTQIGCAQCHDHPFDRWTQKEFYELAAFTGSTSTRVSQRSFGGRQRIAELTKELEELKPDQRVEQRFRQFLRTNLYSVYDNPKAKLRYPHDYAYDNAKPGEVATPHTIWGEQPVIATGESPRVAFARWLTSPDNPRFALTVANRLWAKCLGVGVLEPLDDIRDESVPENKPLLDFLTAEMVRVGFDLKAYLRIIYNTQTYQRQATLAEVVPGEEYHFPGPILRRMSAEQVWDSFMTLAVEDPDAYQQIPARVENELLNVDVETVKASEVVAKLEDYGEKLGRRAQAAHEEGHKYQGLLLARASELPTPAPAAHFLRQFGQSDRELISAASTEGSVPQVLQMFNGPITHMLLDQRSLMYKNVTAEKNTADRVDVIFKSILNRAPSREESQVAVREIQANGPAGYGNVIWALVNTREFLFIQ